MVLDIIPIILDIIPIILDIIPIILDMIPIILDMIPDVLPNIILKCHHLLLHCLLQVFASLFFSLHGFIKYMFTSSFIFLSSCFSFIHLALPMFICIY